MDIHYENKIWDFLIFVTFFCSKINLEKNIKRIKYDHGIEYVNHKFSKFVS